MLSTTVLAPIAFVGSFALAAPALQSAFQQHGESFGPILRDAELGALPTQRALCAARDELHPKAREALQAHRPGFGLQVARVRGTGYRRHLSFLPFGFPPLSS